MADRIDSITTYWKERLDELDVSGFDVTGRLLVVARHVVDRRAEVLSRFGLSPGEFDVLAALSHMTDRGRSHGVNAVVLVDAALVTSGAITKRLDRLEKAGLATRSPDPDDRRATLVKLTTKGRRTIDKAIREVMEGETEFLAPLPAAERKRFLGPLRQLVAAIDEDPEKVHRGKRVAGKRPRRGSDPRPVD